MPYDVQYFTLLHKNFLYYLTEVYIMDAVKRARFISRLRRYASNNDLEFRWDESRGKGSHGTVYVGDRRTTVKTGELKPGYVRLLLDQLGLPPDALT